MARRIAQIEHVSLTLHVSADRTRPGAKQTPSIGRYLLTFSSCSDIDSWCVGGLPRKLQPRDVFGRAEGFANAMNAVSMLLSGGICDILTLVQCRTPCDHLTLVGSRMMNPCSYTSHLVVSLEPLLDKAWA